MRQRKSEAVLTSARTLFLAHGFDGTTVDEIARHARVSKATVYSNFADKSAVLEALLDRVGAESASILEQVVAPLREEQDVEEGLVRTAVALALGVLRPEVLQLRRLAVAESGRFPAAVAQYFDCGPRSSLLLLADAFRVLHDRGALDVPDAEAAAARFAYAAVAPLQDRAILGGETLDEAAVTAFAGESARAFLRAHRTA